MRREFVIRISRSLLCSLLLSPWGTLPIVKKIYLGHQLGLLLFERGSCNISISTALCALYANKIIFLPSPNSSSEGGGLAICGGWW